MTAIACFASYPESYSNVIAQAIGLGDDTDTVAAMAGAISGAHLGIAAIPQHLLVMMENGAKGRDYINGLAMQLASIEWVGEAIHLQLRNSPDHPSP